jgi:transcriptional regulator GlxA family with amidase domain
LKESTFSVRIPVLARIDIHNLEEWARMAQQSAYRVGPLTRELKVSRRQLQRYTRQAFGKSPQQWLDAQRLIRAAEMLQQSFSVKAVCFELGFKQVSHFSREFKLYHGLPPTRFVTRGDKQRPQNRATKSRPSEPQSA